MKKAISLVLVLMMVTLAGVAFTACSQGERGERGEQGAQGYKGLQGERGEAGKNAYAMNFDLNSVMVREQRGTERFYKVGSAHHTGTETRGHFGEEAENAVTVSGRTLTINTTYSATHVAINVGDLFTRDYFADSKVWLSAFRSTNAPIELVHRAPGTEGANTNNLFVYPNADEGWEAKGDTTAYFVMNVSANNTVAPGASVIRQVDVLYNGQINTFYVVINRALAPTA